MKQIQLPYRDQIIELSVPEDIYPDNYSVDNKGERYYRIFDGTKYESYYSTDDLIIRFNKGLINKLKPMRDPSDLFDEEELVNLFLRNKK